MDITNLAFPAIVTIGALLVYFGLGIGVGVARFKYKVAPPQTTGNDDFERVYRTHQNTLEQIVIFLPCLWLFSIFVDPNWGAIWGTVWIVGRIAYAWGYYIEASKRAAGNAIATLAMLSLLLGTLFNLVPVVITHSAIATPMTLFSFSGKRPTNLGVTDGKLLPCPITPNCVSSQSDDIEHKIAPLTYKGDSKKALADLKEVISSLPRTKIITDADNYLYVEFKSALMGYVDDVEFYLNTDLGIIEVRSASRLGQSDLGVNRNRIEAIRAKI